MTSVLNTLSRLLSLPAWLKGTPPGLLVDFRKGRRNGKASCFLLKTHVTSSHVPLVGT